MQNFPKKCIKIGGCLSLVLILIIFTKNPAVNTRLLSIEWSMDWFLYDRHLRHERVKERKIRGCQSVVRKTQETKVNQFSSQTQLEVENILS